METLAQFWKEDRTGKMAKQEQKHEQMLEAETPRDAPSLKT